MSMKTDEGQRLKQILDEQVEELARQIDITDGLGWQRTRTSRREQTARLKLIDALTDMIEALETEVYG